MLNHAVVFLFCYISNLLRTYKWSWSNCVILYHIWENFNDFFKDWTNNPKLMFQILLGLDCSCLCSSNCQHDTCCTDNVCRSFWIHDANFLRFVTKYHLWWFQFHDMKMYFNVMNIMLWMVILLSGKENKKQLRC